MMHSGFTDLKEAFGGCQVVWGVSGVHMDYATLHLHGAV